jgi:hypothetical protein
MIAAFLNRLKPSITATRCFTSMVLLNEIVQVFRRTHLRVRGQQAIGFKFAHRAVRSRVAVQRDRRRGAALALDRLAEERLGSANITMGAQPEVDRPRRPVNGAVEVTPLASDFDVGLVDPPRRTHRRTEPFPPLLELGHVALHPAHDGRVSQGKAALAHHLHQVAQAQLEPQIPAHAEHNHLSVEVTTSEQFLHALRPGHRAALHRSAISIADQGAPFAPEPNIAGSVTSRSSRC